MSLGLIRERAIDRPSLETHYRSSCEGEADGHSRQKEGISHITYKAETVQDVLAVKVLKGVIKRRTYLLCRRQVRRTVLVDGCNSRRFRVLLLGQKKGGQA